MNLALAGHSRLRRGFPRSRYGFSWVLPWLLCALGLGGNPARAQSPQPSEYQLKAAFIYHFAQFVEWPPAAFPDAKAPFVIGILGNNPFGDSLEQTVNGKTINEHPFVVKEFHSAAQAAKAVQILFISASEQKRFPEIFAALGRASVLTVSEADHVLDGGPIINFILEGGRIRFQINEEPARRVGLKISSKLLSLASHRAQ